MGKLDILALNEPTSVLDVSGVKLREAGTNGWTVSIKEGTEYQIHLPYILNDFRNRYTTEMTDREFSYYISNLPPRAAFDTREGGLTTDMRVCPG